MHQGLYRYDKTQLFNLMALEALRCRSVNCSVISQSVTVSSILNSLTTSTAIIICAVTTSRSPAAAATA